MDEGKGLEIHDITDNEINLTLKDESQWREETLENGDPIDFEDKWGKENQPNYAIVTHSIYLIIICLDEGFEILVPTTHIDR